jgi:PST family polysaccharide transporter
MLSAFSLMAVVTGFVAPAMQILVRDRIILQFSVADAGYWQAVTKISDYYLSFITSVLGVYYMPRLSEIQSKAELKNEIFKGYKIILPVVGIIAFLIWVLKGFIIQVLFTPEFSPMKPLFTYQLLGDFFKIGSWLLAYLMIAKAMTKTYIATEIIFAASYVVLSYYFMNHYGIIGATYSFCINYALYWLSMWALMRKKII